MFGLTQDTWLALLDALPVVFGLGWHVFFLGHFVEQIPNQHFFFEGGVNIKQSSHSS